jgi:hypothetical protein
MSSIAGATSRMVSRSIATSMTTSTARPTTIAGCTRHARRAVDKMRIRHRLLENHFAKRSARELVMAIRDRDEARLCSAAGHDQRGQLAGPERREVEGIKRQARRCQRAFRKLSVGKDRWPQNHLGPLRRPRPASYRPAPTAPGRCDRLRKRTAMLETEGKMGNSPSARS